MFSRKAWGDDKFVAVVGWGSIALAILGAVAFITVPETRRVYVKGKSWRIVQHVEELQRGVKKEGWCCPSGAYDVHVTNELHHHDTMFVGDVPVSHPVYRSYYRYKIDLWQRVEPRVTTGEGSGVIYPDTACKNADQRMDSREDSYILVIEEDTNSTPRKAWVMNASADLWGQWSVGDRAEARVNIAAGVLSLHRVAEGAR